MRFKNYSWPQIIPVPSLSLFPSSSLLLSIFAVTDSTETETRNARDREKGRKRHGQ